MSKEVFKLANASKQTSECEMIDALRFKKYIGCFVYKNRHLPPNEFAKKAMAPVEHLFIHMNGVIPSGVSKKIFRIVLIV